MSLGDWLVAFRKIKKRMGLGASVPSGEKKNVAPVESAVVKAATSRMHEAIATVRLLHRGTIPDDYELQPTRRVTRIIYDGRSFYFNPDYVYFMSTATLVSVVEKAVMSTKNKA
jgi:hypothetical protein